MGNELQILNPSDIKEDLIVFFKNKSLIRLLAREYHAAFRPARVLSLPVWIIGST